MECSVGSMVKHKHRTKPLDEPAEVNSDELQLDIEELDIVDGRELLASLGPVIRSKDFGVSIVQYEKKTMLRLLDVEAKEVIVGIISSTPQEPGAIEAIGGMIMMVFNGELDSVLPKKQGTKETIQ